MPPLPPATDPLLVTTMSAVALTPTPPPPPPPPLRLPFTPDGPVAPVPPLTLVEIFPLVEMTWPAPPVAPGTPFGEPNVEAVPSRTSWRAVARCEVNTATAATGGRTIGGILTRGTYERAVHATLSTAPTPLPLPPSAHAGAALSPNPRATIVMAETLARRETAGLRSKRLCVGPPRPEAVSYFQIFAKQLRSAAAGWKPPCSILIPVKGYLVVVRSLHPRCICALVLCFSLGPPGTRTFSCTRPTRLSLTLDESSLADNRSVRSTPGIRSGVLFAQRRRRLTISFEIRREYRAHADLLHALQLATRLARFAVRVTRAAIDHAMAGICRRRERRSLSRPTKTRMSDLSDHSSGFGAAWDAFAAA